MSAAIAVLAANAATRMELKNLKVTSPKKVLAKQMAVRGIGRAAAQKAIKTP
jgi:hypothetical protein